MPRPRKYDESDVLNKAMSLFWKQGYRNTSIKDLEKMLNLKASSIYHAYGSKELLFIKTIELYLVKVVDKRIEKYLRNDHLPMENIKAFFLSVIEKKDSENIKIGCFLTNTATEIGTSLPEVSKKIQLGMEKIKDAFHLELLEAKKAKMIAPSCDLKEVATMLLLNYQGLLVMARLNYSCDVLTQTTLCMLNKLEE